MRLLLDTHAVLWAIGSPATLTDQARDAIKDPDNLILVSAVSAWEIAIKVALGKLVFAGSVSEHVVANDFTPLPISLAHAEGIGDLPPVHSDPFDRLLVSQALAEDAVIVTRDRHLAGYDVRILPA
ncbi:MAG: type II toxin-antitoxin system VapC family toxin [Euzebya sp.]